MEPIQPHELSAFLDGELSGQRMHEIRQQLDIDDGLRARFDAYQRLDRSWRAAAIDARFQPSVEMPVSPEPRPRVVGVVALGAALAGLRLLSKVLGVEMVLWALVNAGVLAALLAATAWLINRERDAQGSSH